jgi:regulator of sigma E protease
MTEFLSTWLATPFNWALLGLGFGFVIFWHELGHFLAAKYVGIKVEQFAVGFGQPLLAWRKGLGLRWGFGGTQNEYEHRVKEQLAKTHADTVKIDEPREWSDIEFAKASAEIGISETEYRLNWIPLGGYVKMLGQDDMKPGQEAEDPRAYNKKSVGARMLVVSAGVIMNVFLAAIGFMVVFLVGFPAPPPVVGDVLAGSPAQIAGLQVGDRILTIDGKVQHDFTKIQLNTALADPTVATPITYLRDGQEKRSTITAARSGDADTDFLMLGVAAPYELRGAPMDKWRKRDQAEFDKLPDDAQLIGPGDVIRAVNGQPVDVKDIAAFDAMIQASGGRPLELSVMHASGKLESRQLQPTFGMAFGAAPINLLGMQPLPRITLVTEASSAYGKLKAGDVVVAISDGVDRLSDPSIVKLRRFIITANENERKLSMEVLRDGQRLTFDELDPNRKLADGSRGLNVGLDFAWGVAQTAAPVEKSTADGVVPAGLSLSTVDGKPVASWYDVREVLRDTLSKGKPIVLTGTVDGEATEVSVTPTSADVKYVQGLRYTHGLVLTQMDEPRKTSNPFVAAMWGVGETRDAILQVYLTVQRMTQGHVSYKNVSGPVGIFAAGYKFADRGSVWLAWFLSIISANLAVMNFLPIPIVDGGLFTFLIIEKIKGRPVSPKVQQIAQVVGLAILLSVFLLATYQDISRLSLFMR